MREETRKERDQRGLHDEDLLHDELELFVADERPVTISLWDTQRLDQRGRSVLGYDLSHGELTIFYGEDFAGSPLHADDSDATLAALLSFLALKPGDTDREYFASYTEAQLEWVGDYGEGLSLLAEALSECTVRSLEDLLRSHEFEETRSGSSSDDWINDPERRGRVDAAAAFGAEGSTHGELIEDWRMCLRSCFPELPDLVRRRIEAEIDATEEWHEQRGSLDDQVG